MFTRQFLSESFNIACETPEEATQSAREMVENLENKGQLLKAPIKDNILGPFDVTKMGGDTLPRTQ